MELLFQGQQSCIWLKPFKTGWLQEIYHNWGVKIRVYVWPLPSREKMYEALLGVPIWEDPKIITAWVHFC